MILTYFEILAILLSATGVLAWLNLRTLAIPNTIALLLLGLAASVILFLVNQVYPDNAIYETLETMLEKLDFYDLVMHGMLAFLLFAGALQIDVQKLYNRWLGVGSLATIGVFVSASVVAVGLWAATQAMGLPLSFAWCFVFGALIAPTDPVAVLAVLQSVKLPESLKIDLSGETLFNDGIGVVLFIIALSVATGSQEVDALSILQLFLMEAGGGAVLGFVIGYLGYRGMKMIDDYVVEIILSLGVVTATYALAERLTVSGPISVVVAGALIGHIGRRRAMSDRTKTYLFGFWELVDQILNSVLFFVIGLEILAVGLEPIWAYLAISAVFIVLFARLVAVTGAVVILDRWQRFPKGTVAVLTWGAVRGAIPVALALSLPAGPERGHILTATYATVLFSVVIQALTLPKVVQVFAGGSGKEG